MSSQQEDYSSYVASLPGIDDPEALKQLAIRDTRGEVSDYARQYLEGPEMIGDYQQMLLEIIKDIDVQLVEKKARLDEYHLQCRARAEDGKQDWYEEKARYERWRGGALRVKRSAEQRRRELRSIIKARNVADKEERDATKQYNYRRVLVHVQQFLWDLQQQEGGETFLVDLDLMLDEVNEALRGKS
jgi:hypothetical protein